MLTVVFVFWCNGTICALDVDCCMFFGVLCAFNVLSIDDDMFLVIIKNVFLVGIMPRWTLCTYLFFLMMLGSFGSLVSADGFST